ncbi:hypothetical protein PVAND_000246 [Polypedilum vanderplanki]|uniref:C-type lectin n=1 Tax=Polypedilum vanderplanki TaxID=319348 RepID=A0A9J6BJH3_POLVA|nr:hypothetical protein PVAND_000246 [Polypedilum vanderplanki]
MMRALRIFLCLTFVILINDSFEADTSMCYGKYPIYNAAGKLIKRVCLISGSDSYTYDGAEKYCRIYGMQPLVIQNANAAKVMLQILAEVVNQLWPECTMINWPELCNVGINGRKSSNNQWYTYTHEVLPLYANFTWIEGIPLGNCLTLKVLNGNLAVKPYPCEWEIARFCEYDVA